MPSYRLISIALVLLPIVASAQELPRSIHVVRASAEATVTAKPDQAQISIGVTTQAPTAQQTASDNATASTQVISALKRAIGDRAEVSTTGYSVAPNYESPTNGPRKISGYQANNTVSATINDLSLVGKIIDLATQSGANQINGVSFTLRNGEAVRNQALAEAAKKARSNAEAIANALGLQVVGILEAQSGEAEPAPRLQMQMVRAVGVPAIPTPIEVGNLEIRASVTVALEVR